MMFASGERHWIEREFILLFISFPRVLLGLFIFTLNIFTLLIKNIATWADMKQGSMTEVTTEMWTHAVGAWRGWWRVL